MSFDIIQGKVLEGTDAENVGFLVDSLKQNIVRAAWSTWTVTVTDEETETQVYTFTSADNQDISNVFAWYDTPQTDDRWGTNSQGYNYYHNVRTQELTGSSALKAGHAYRFTYAFAMTDGSTKKQQFRWLITSD